MRDKFLKMYLTKLWIVIEQIDLSMVAYFTDVIRLIRDIFDGYPKVCTIYPEPISCLEGGIDRPGSCPAVRLTGPRFHCRVSHIIKALSPK